MPNHLTLLEPIPLPDVQRPAKLTSLPQWVTERLASLKKELRPNEAGVYREIPVTPQALIPTEPQRAAIACHLGSLDSALAMTPEASSSHAQATLTTVSKMLMALAGKEMGELTAQAKGEAYMAALEDVPFWAVELACKRWYRGECGERDYRWAPDPASLRELTFMEIFRVKAVARGLRNLLEAKPEEVPDPEKQAAMRVKLRGLGLLVDNEARA